MPQHLYKQLEEAYQRGVNKEHKPNPARTHPMSSQQGKGCPGMPITQTATCRTTQSRRLTAWTSTDIKECPATYRDHTLGIAAAQPAEKTKSGTSEMSWTKHEEMHEACQMTSEN